MIQRLLLLAIVLGVAARVVLWPAHEHPRGDVLLDVGVARSVMSGEGFASGFERGTAMVRGDDPIPPQDMADQHPPLWPLVGAVLGTVTGSAYSGLQLGSLLLGVLLLILVWRETDRMTEGCNGAPDGLPAIAAALVALSFLMLDYSVNGSLYVGQACLVVMLVRGVASKAPSAWKLGLVLGAAWMLNHQAAVLLVVPLVVLMLAPPDGNRAKGAAVAFGAIAIAALVCVPWWWRNAQVFGDPFFSVNAFYPLLRAGVEPVLGFEGGVPTVRMPDASLAVTLLRAQTSLLPPNVLYLISTGLMVWPGLLAIVAAGAWPIFRESRRTGDRRVIACLVALVLLLGVSLAWPAMKLRYFVPMTPLVVMLGLRLLATAPLKGERLLSWLVVLVWLGALLYTIGDLTGSEADPRPNRWKLLALAGAIFLALPLLLRHTKLAERGMQLGLCSGVLVVPVLCVLALSHEPHTAYHSSPITPDFFGKAKEQADERRADTFARAQQTAVAAGGTLMVGPIELLAHAEPAMILGPMGAGVVQDGVIVGDEALKLLLDRGDVDHVFVFATEGWPEGLAVGERWLDDRLEVTGTWSSEDGATPMAGGTLSRVIRR